VQRFRDDKLNDLLTAISAEVDAQKRLQLTGDAQRYLLDNAYVIPIFEEPQVFAGAPWVKGVSFEAVGRPSFYGAGWKSTKESGMSHNFCDVWARVCWCCGRPLPSPSSCCRCCRGCGTDQVSEPGSRSQPGANRRHAHRLRRRQPALDAVFPHLSGDAAGDFGYSLQAGIAVSTLLASNLPDTLSLAIPAFILAIALAFSLAFASRLPGLRWLSNTCSLCRCCLSRCRPSGWALP
jgi:hypothetical protein